MDSVTIEDRYVIVEIGGKQYQAIEGKTILVDKIEGEPGDKLKFKTILLKKDGPSDFKIGQPYLTSYELETEIIKQKKLPKLDVFKFKRRKKYRVKKGHRQSATVLRILSLVTASTPAATKQEGSGSVASNTAAKPAAEKPTTAKVTSPKSSTSKRSTTK